MSSSVFQDETHFNGVTPGLKNMGTIRMRASILHRIGIPVKKREAFVGHAIVDLNTVLSPVCRSSTPCFLEGFVPGPV
jgi:hypothetical protein